MKTLFVASLALSMLAFGSTGALAGGIGQNANNYDGTADASPDCADIDTVMATSDGANITVMVTLQADVANCLSQTKYRVHFDYDDANGIASEVSRESGTCVILNPDNASGTTSDDGHHIRKTGGGTKATGPGTSQIVGSLITVDVGYGELGLFPGDLVEIWVDTQRKGSIDRAPNTDATDGCAKPTGAGEVLQIELYDNGG